jgi:ubiquinone/menaquinone biosynthesis C-methylase UbiE
MLRQGSRVLDLGCGPGTLVIPLARYAGTVIAIDPSAEMIQTASRLGAEAGVTVDWRLGSSQDLDSSIAPLDLVVMGRSFHWMDRAATLARLDRLVARHGAIALFDIEGLTKRGDRWGEAFHAVRAEFEQRDEFDAFRRTPEWEHHHEVLLQSTFSRLERFGVIEERTSTIDEIVSRALSHSGTTPRVLAERLDAFVATLKDGLRAAHPDGRFAEIVESVALLARRPG